MAETALIDRLASLPKWDAVPREELEWLVAHGSLQTYQPGDVFAPKGVRLENLVIILSGYITIRVDRGSGLRHVIQWGVGEVTGKLPYSRMTGPPGNNFVVEVTEVLSIHERHYSELINRCPVFTEQTVHEMLDRARRFNAGDLQGEKMISLGKLASGLAHELNNPASAIIRSAKYLTETLKETENAARLLGQSGYSDELISSVEQFRDRCLLKPTRGVLNSIQLADREDEITDWLISRGANPDHAIALAETAVTLEDLEELAGMIPGEMLNTVLRWLSSGCATHSLAEDIQEAAERIYELVAAVKRFTYMDQLAGPESVDVEAGLGDTIRVLASKSRSKDASIVLDIQPNLPRAKAAGGELNQVWMNLIDNALDAIPSGGHIEVCAQSELDRVVVRVIDDGSGIAPDILSKIFDPFFTTKPQGQGTGLGLEITRRIVRQNSGDITVKSQPGRTEFKVSLLMAESNLAEDGKQP